MKRRAVFRFSVSTLFPPASHRLPSVAGGARERPLRKTTRALLEVLLYEYVAHLLLLLLAEVLA